AARPERAVPLARRPARRGGPARVALVRRAAGRELLRLSAPRGEKTPRTTASCATVAGAPATHPEPKMDAAKTLHILLTTDGSEESLRAVEPAALLARRTGGRITLLRIVPELTAISDTGFA